MPKKDKSENFKSQYRKSNPNNPIIECWTNIVNLPFNSLFQCTQSRTSQVETSRNCTATRGQYVQNYFYYSPSRNFENAIKSILLFFSFCIESNLQIRNILHIQYIYLIPLQRSKSYLEISIDGKATNQLSFSIFTLTPTSGYDTYTYDICICLLHHHCLLFLYVCSPYCVPTPIIYIHVNGTFLDFVSFAKTKTVRFRVEKKLWKKKYIYSIWKTGGSHRIPKKLVLRSIFVGDAFSVLFSTICILSELYKYTNLIIRKINKIRKEIVLRFAIDDTLCQDT